MNSQLQLNKKDYKEELRKCCRGEFILRLEGLYIYNYKMKSKKTEMQNVPNFNFFACPHLVV